VILLKLEMPIPDPLLRGFLGKLNRLEFYGSVKTPQMASPCMKPRRFTYRSSKLAEPILLGAVARNEQTKKQEN
jgi:hypothetical protein